MWCNGTNSPGDCTVSYFSPSTTTLLRISPDTQDGLSGRRGASRLGGGAQPVLHVDGDAKKPAAAHGRRAGKNCRCSRPTNPRRRKASSPRSCIRHKSSRPMHPSKREVTLYAGPKEIRTLALIGDQFQQHADYVLQFGLLRIFSPKACCWR